MAESHAETTRMARRLFVAPPPRRMVLPILAFSIMEAYLLVYPALDWGRVLLGTAAIAVPAYASALLTKPVAAGLGGRMYFRRSFLLVFVGLILLGAFEVVAVSAFSIVAIVNNTSFFSRIDKFAVLGYGAILWVREVILSATSNSKHVRSLPAAALHPFLGLVGMAFFVPLSLLEFIVDLLVLA
ncbi:MAG: DUF2070 family protein, partial [Thermoplasmata archaeon]